MTPADLRQLVQDIKAGPPTRELADRCLLARGWTRREWMHNLSWYQPNGGNWHPSIGRPNPLENLEDATLMVPEGSRGKREWALDSEGFARVVLWIGDWPHIICASVKDNPAQALTLASLNAMIAEMEQ